MSGKEKIKLECFSVSMLGVDFTSKQADVVFKIIEEEKTELFEEIEQSFFTKKKNIKSSVEIYHNIFPKLKQKHQIK